MLSQLILLSFPLLVSMQHASTAICFPSTDFRIEMADETLIDRNDIDHHNFAESLCTLLIGIQNINAHDVSTDYFEGTNLRPK